MTLFTQDLSKSCGIGSVEGRKIKCLKGSRFTDSQVAHDDSNLVELSIHILLTPAWPAFILQYFSSPVFMTKYFGKQASFIIYRSLQSFGDISLKVTMQTFWPTNECMYLEIS